jgi:flavin reductase (DIM6/NTAB) family NADH-FMN oxidoreductase RutF
MRKDIKTKSWLYPMPVFMVAAYDRNGVPNVMNAAWGGMYTDDMIGVCLSEEHKTTINIREKGAFTVNIATADYVVACDYVGIVSGNKVLDKFAKAGFHAVRSKYVDAPIIEELPMALECEMVSYDEESNYLVGRIVNTSVDTKVLNGERVDVRKMRPITYDPSNREYLVLGDVVGKAFSDGKRLKDGGGLTLLERAVEIAREAHEGQKDKAGKEYVEHPLRVMRAGRNIDEQIVGVLHDVVEDSNWTFEQLEVEGFSSDIIEALRCLTHDKQELSYEQYIKGIQKNELAKAVKINDLKDNMDVSRLPYLADKDIKRLKKYLKAYKELTNEPKYSVYACQQEFPNAYKPWTDSDDSMLAQLFNDGKSINELAKHFQRKPGGIRSRLLKLKLIDKS